MGKNIEELKKKYIDVVNDYMHTWADKHEYNYEEDMWVSNSYGGICMVGDMYVNFDDVRYDVDNELPENVFDEWYWYSVEIAELGCTNSVNLGSYARGARPYGDEQIRKIKDAKKRVQEAQSILEDAIRDANLPF